MLGDCRALAVALEEAGLDADHLPSVLKSAQKSIERLRSDSDVVTATGELIDRVELGSAGVKVTLRFPVPEARGDSKQDHFPLVKFVPVQFKRRGVEKKIVIESARTPNCVDLPLLKAVGRARRWTDDLISGQVQSVYALAKREGLDRRSVRRLLRLGFLSPRIAEMIAEGRQSPDMTVCALVRRLDFSVLWSTQEEAMFGAHTVQR